MAHTRVPGILNNQPGKVWSFMDILVQRNVLMRVLRDFVTLRTYNSDVTKFYILPLDGKQHVFNNSYDKNDQQTTTKDYCFELKHIARVLKQLKCDWLLISRCAHFSEERQQAT